MPTLTLIPPEHADAIREDVVSGNACEEARKRLGVVALYVLANRHTLRIGERPPHSIDEWVHRDRADHDNWLAVRPIYVKQEPRCRCCGKLLHHGDRVIVFGFKPSYWNYQGRRSFIHADREGCL